MEARGSLSTHPPASTWWVYRITWGSRGIWPTTQPTSKSCTIEKRAREIATWVQAMRNDLGATIDRIDLGGGFRGGNSVTISVPGEQPPLDLDLPATEAYAIAIREGLEGLDLDGIRLQFESGGYLVSNAVLLLTTIAEVKQVTDRAIGRYVSV